MIGTALMSGALAAMIGAPHCAGMCGPLASFACQRSQARLPFHLSRIVAYTLAGALVAALGASMMPAEAGEARSLSRNIEAILALALAGLMFLLALRPWFSRPASPLVPLRKSSGRSLTAARQEGTGRAAPKALVASLLGLVSALLPCGLLWSVLLLAWTSLSWQRGAAILASFSLVSAAVLLLSARCIAGLRRWIAPRWQRHASALVFVFVGVLLVLRAWPALQDQGSCCHRRDAHASAHLLSRAQKGQE